MNRKKQFGWARGLVLLAVCATLWPATFRAQTQGGSSVAVIVNGDTPVSDLSLDEVRKIFLGDRQYWTAKLPVVLLIRAPEARERDVALQAIYRMSEVQFKRYWIAKVFRAESGTAPRVVYSNDSANDLTAAIPGAITLVDARDVRPGVKIIRIDGYLPSDAAYPLK
jgi:hypothetical protein